MREQIARAAGFNRVSWKERKGTGGPGGGEKEGEGDNNEENATSAREERETEIIVEITYELRAEETGGNEIERGDGWVWDVEFFSSRLFNYLSRL